MSKPSFDFIDQALSRRKNNRTYRKLTPVDGNNCVDVFIDGKQLVNFCSNDYLGLSSHPRLKINSINFIQKHGAGSGASRLVSGNWKIHEQAEKKLADVFKSEASLIFNTGFQANLSILSSLADRHSLILADKKCHNSIIQGARLSRADFKRFRHNDYDHLRMLLNKSQNHEYERIWIVSETLFSMDGDTSSSETLLDIAGEYNAYLYLDEAHAIGVLGEHGLGLTCSLKNIDIKLGTFGKSFGSFGAFILCSDKMKEYLINFCPGFIYTTALPPAVLGSIDAALDLIPSMNTTRKKLFAHIERVLYELKKMGFKTGGSRSQIIPVIVGNARTALELSNWLKSNGIWASAIRPPTVPENEARIRLAITAKHTDDHIEKLINVLRSWKKR